LRFAVEWPNITRLWSSIPSIVPIPKKGVVANGRAKTCLGPLVRAVPGAPQSRSVCVSIPDPPSLVFPKFPRGTIPRKSEIGGAEAEGKNGNIELVSGFR